MTDTHAADIADRLWRAYAPFQRGRDTVSDLASMLALLVLARFVESTRGSADDFVKQWDRAVAEAGIGVSPVMDLRAAMSHAGRHPGFPLPELRVFEFLDSYQQPDDVPWVAAFLVALTQPPTPTDAELPDVAALLLDRHVQESPFTVGEFPVPPAVARLLVGLTRPRPGDRVLDPACGSGGLLTAAVARIAERGRVDGASIEAYTTDPGNVELAAANLAVHGVDRPVVRVSDPLSLFNRGDNRVVDVVMSNPPFNQRIKNIGSGYWPFGDPPESNANFAWLQLALSRLSQDGIASMIMPLSAAWSSGREGNIRRNMVKGGVLLGVIALPPNLFAHTAVPVHIWLLARDKSRHLPSGEQDSTLFIDARQLGRQATRQPRVLTTNDVERISTRLQDWLKSPGTTPDEPGFSRSVKHAELLENDGSLDPRLYVNIGQKPPTSAANLTQVLDELDRHVEATTASSAELRESLDKYERLIRNEAEPTHLTLGEIAAGGLIAGPSGSHIRAEHYVEISGVPVVMPKDLAGDGFSTAHIRHITELQAGKLERFRLRQGDVVLARRGELGRCAVVRAAQHGWVCGTGCFILRAVDGLDADYFAAYLQSSEARKWLQDHSTGGTAMKTISLAALSKLPVPLPDLWTQRAVADMTARLDHHERLLRAQLDLTQAIRRDARRPTA